MLLSILDTWDSHIHTWASALGQPVEMFIRLVLAVTAGGLVGLDREIRGREAGFRTNILVCLGSALVMIVSTHFAAMSWTAQPGVNINVDPARIAYGVMTGVGFLGAGTIIHHRGTVSGLTTAAALWCVAAVGLAVGLGLYVVSALATILIVVALWLLDYVENAVPKRRQRNMTIRVPYEPDCVNQCISYIRNAGFRVHDVNFERSSDLASVDVQMEIGVVTDEKFVNLARRIAEDGEYQVLCGREG